MSKLDSSNSAPSLPQLTDPPEVKAAHHDNSLIPVAMADPAARGSTSAGDAMVSVSSIADTVVDHGVFVASTPAIASNLIRTANTHNVHTTDDHDTAATHIANVTTALTDNQDVASIPKLKRIHMSYVHKCIQVNKSFFLINNDKENDIPQDF